MKEKSPSPRERKRRQQAAKKRDKEQRGIPYWLRNRGEEHITEPEEDD